MIKAGWHAENPEFRRFFTARLLPDAPPEISREFDEMQKRAVDPGNMLANLDLMCKLDVTKEAKDIPHSTLLIHSAGDCAISVDEGSRLASMMCNAELTIVDGNNHILLPGSPGSEQAIVAIENFLGDFVSQFATLSMS